MHQGLIQVQHQSLLALLLGLLRLQQRFCRP
jgi:hypothetical protein